MPRLRVHHLVAAEFLEAQAWYAGLSPLAAERFLTCFDAALDRIRLRPTSCAPWRCPPFRRVRLFPFPYLLLFHCDHHQTSVLALAHQRRKPEATFAALARRQGEL